MNMDAMEEVCGSDSSDNIPCRVFNNLLKHTADTTCV